MDQYDANQCTVQAMQMRNQVTSLKDNVKDVNQNNNNVLTILDDNATYGSLLTEKFQFIDDEELEKEESLIDDMGNIEGKLHKHNALQNGLKEINEIHVHKRSRKRKKEQNKLKLKGIRLSENYDNVSEVSSNATNDQINNENDNATTLQGESNMSAELEAAINQLCSYDPNIQTSLQSEIQNSLAGLNLEETLLTDEILTSEALSDIATVISGLQDRLTTIQKENGDILLQSDATSTVLNAVGFGTKKLSLKKKDKEKETSRSLPSLFEKEIIEIHPTILHRSNSLPKLNNLVSKTKNCQTKILAEINLPGDFKEKVDGISDNDLKNGFSYEDISHEILNEIIEKICNNEVSKMPNTNSETQNNNLCSVKNTEDVNMLSPNSNTGLLNENELTHFRGRSLSLSTKPSRYKKKVDKKREKNLQKFKGESLYNWLLNGCENKTKFIKELCQTLLKYKLIVSLDNTIESTQFQQSAYYTWNTTFITSPGTSPSTDDDVMFSCLRQRRTSLPAYIVKSQLIGNQHARKLSRSYSKRQFKRLAASPVTMTTPSGTIETSFGTNFKTKTKLPILETNLDHKATTNLADQTPDLVNSSTLPNQCLALPTKNTMQPEESTMLPSQSTILIPTSSQNSISSQNTVLPNGTNRNSGSYNKTVILVNIGTQTSFEPDKIDSKSSTETLPLDSEIPPPPDLGIPQPPGLGIPPPPSLGIPPPPSLGIPPPPSLGIPLPPSLGIPPPPGLGIPPPPNLGIPPPPSLGTPPPPNLEIPPPPNLGGIPPPLPMPNVQPKEVPKVPLKPMKALYWKKIKTSQVQPKKNIWSTIKEECLDEEEVTELFCKITVERKKHVSNAAVAKKASKKVKCVKLLDTKRSQMVAIFLSSLSVNSDEIKTAILNVDTSSVDVEVMMGIYEQRPQAGELELIRSHVEKEANLPDDKKQPLDRAEEFLWKLWGTPCLSDRLFCIIFSNHFQNDVRDLKKMIATVDDVCQELKGEAVTRLLGIILSVGNCMNRGNDARGEAEGFELEILGKLRDVRANRGKETLLSYVIVAYIRMAVKDDDVSAVTCPIPQTVNLLRAAGVCYNDLLRQRKKIELKLKDCSRRVKTVLSKTEESQVEPFKSSMEEFIKTASFEIEELETKVNESQKSFKDTVDCFDSKCLEPKDFFELWIPFVSDFNELWKPTIAKEVATKQKQVDVQIKSVLRTRTRKRLKHSLIGPN